MACQPVTTLPPVRPGATSQPGPVATAALPDTPGEAGVITGRVTTEEGLPIEGAEIRIVGYTGGANLGQEIQTVETGADGVYRAEVPNGLYETLGTAAIPFDGQVYVFNLEQADGQCDQQMSEDGIVDDFVLRLTGISPCDIGADPDNYVEYHGAPIQLFDRFAGSPSPDDVVEFTFEPTGPLADGSSGGPVYLYRTVAAFDTSFGPIDSTYILHDIPLARYLVSAVLIQPGVGSEPLFVSTPEAPTPAMSAEMTFDARLVIGTPDVGYVVPQLYIHDSQ